MFKRILLFALSCAAAVTPAAAYESLTYLYGSTTATYLNRVERTGDNLDIVAPDYFEVDENGDMKYTKSVDPLLIAAMHDKKITVTPFLSNHWNRANARAMLAKRAQVAAVLAGAVSQHGLDGLDIDIQNITDADRAAFSDFIRLLRAAMPQGKTLTVCVAANPYYTNIGWQGAYDYAELNKYCDHIFIMTYDESFEGGDPGPVASYWFIETSIKYALQYVPKEKIMIGIPFYGRYWTSA
ncbi:MAG: glycoside hydrolase, partial [Oscillospiraceae bacterium]|nr:glycoside hydrolase [Oscillospiraceae bacterium]